MKIRSGIIDSIIETDNPNIIKVLSDKWAFHVNGYQYTPTYKRGHWDGKKRFVSAAGKFKTGMLANILRDLNQVGCTPEVIKEHGEGPKLIFKRNIKEFKLHDYQQEAISKALVAERAIIKSPTGSGKTLIMAATLTAFPKSKITILFDERSILTQTYEYLTRKCGFKDVGINLGGDFKDGRIMLSTVQSIDKILDSHLNQSEVLMVDEVHKFCRGEMTVAAIQSFPNARYRFGFTATMPDDRIGELTLVGAFGDVIETKSTQELIAEDKLAKPIIQMLEYEDEISEQDLDSDYATIYERFIITSEKRNGIIFSLAAKIAEANPEAKVCILVKNLEHLQTLRNAIPNSFTLEGINTIHERKEAIKDFLECDSAAFLIGTKVLQTGINIEEITHLVNARGLKDKIPTLQGLGRGMRKSVGKTSVMVYDFFDHIPYLREHSKARIRHYEDEGHEVSRIKL
jgi:superfamily II DNA or RNA helicase